jgi:hypothetical protein
MDNLDFKEDLRKCKLKIEKINMNPQEKTQFDQIFINRLISPLSKLFTNNFSLILSLFCVVPTKIELYDVDLDYSNVKSEMLRGMLKEVENKLQLHSYPSFEAAAYYIYATRHVEIRMKFFKDKRLDTEKYISKLFNDYALFLGFVYMHEIMHVFKRDSILNPTLYGYAARRFAEKGAIMTFERIQEVVNIANDYFINGILIKKHPCFDTPLIKTTFFYDEKYDIDNKTNIHILDDIIDNVEIDNYSFGDDEEQNDQSAGGSGEGNSQSDQVSDSSNQNNNQSQQSSQNQEQQSSENQDKDKQDQEQQSSQNDQNNQGNSGLRGYVQNVKIRGRQYTNIILDKSTDEHAEEKSEQQMDPVTSASIISDIINETIAKIRGIGSAETLAELGIPLEIKMHWAKKLRKRVLYLYDEINKQGRTWTKPNIFTRHIATLPGYEKKGKYPILYVMVDSSGSMSDLDLRMINYILEELNIRGFGITVLIHDYELVKKVHFEPKSKEIKEFVKYRYSAGGTSHEEVFKYIEENVDKKDYKKAIVMILSDMYSDINEIYQNYNWPKYIHTIGLVFSNTEYELPFGETIRVE